MPGANLKRALDYHVLTDDPGTSPCVWKAGKRAVKRRASRGAEWSFSASYAFCTEGGGRGGLGYTRVTRVPLRSSGVQGIYFWGCVHFK